MEKDIKQCEGDLKEPLQCVLRLDLLVVLFFEMIRQVRKALLQDLELADTKLRKIQEENE